MFNFFHKKRTPEKLFFGTDIHCHILPGIDDGSPDVKTSVELVGRMIPWGIGRIIASPHVTYGTFPNTPEIADAAMHELHDALQNVPDAPVISHSAENRIDELFMQNLENNTLMTLPDNYLLIENSFIQEPWNLDQMVFDLLVKGYKPIMAHPERYAYYYGKKDRYKDLHNAGLLFQINLLSLAGAYGVAEKKIAEYLIDESLVDFVGTDLHRVRHADAIDSYLASKDYVRHRTALDGRVLNDSLSD
ncbi:MAG: hypothetical protein Q4C34_09090 [Bacteroidales bacterium]|nr:hypothetical protein [Bacteroidales bacterium]